VVRPHLPGIGKALADTTERPDAVAMLREKLNSHARMMAWMAVADNREEFPLMQRAATLRQPKPECASARALT